MKRPYIVCHMVASIDGRIDCSMVDKISGDEYYETLEKLDCPTQLEGRVTMEHYNAAKEPFVANDTTALGMTSVYKAVDSDEYMVAVDTHGKLRWPASEIDGVPLVCIVSEQVAQEYVEMLRKEGISYICVGRGSINLPAAMEILRSEFGVERMAVLGGGHINGGFLAAGLIDEVNRIGVNINEIVYNNNSALYSDSDKSRLFAYMLKLNETLSKVVDDIGDN